MDVQYLIKRHQTWYVNLRVPPKLVDIIGKQRLQRSLKTRDVNEANRLKHAVVAELQNYFNTVRKSLEAGTPMSDLSNAAKVLAEEVKLGQVSRENNDSVWSELLDRYLDNNHTRDMETGEYQTDETTTAQIKIASALVSNPELYLLSNALEGYLKEISKRIRKQTYQAKERRIGDFMLWLKVDKEPGHVTKKEAGKFLTDDLSNRDLSTKSIKDFLSDLSAFFNWMEGRGIIENNPFRGLSGTVRDTSRGVRNTTKRREWTESELLLLLNQLKAKKDARLTTMTLIALYTGMRSNEIAELELTEVHKDYIHIPEAKTETSIRDVPIHTTIKPLINKLIQTSTDGYLISGLKRGGTDQKRNHCIVKRLSTFIRGKVTADSAVVFHSLRKNFSGELERAGITENLAQQIVGHKKQSLTYGLYSQGVKLDQLIEAVSKVSHGSGIDSLVKELSR